MGLYLLCVYFVVQAVILVQGSQCKWDVTDCKRNEISCGETQSILLDAKRPLDNEHCFAIKDKDYGDYRNYEISTDLLSLESAEGQNSGYLGIIFNFLDQKNYDFVYLQ